MSNASEHGALQKMSLQIGLFPFANGAAQLMRRIFRTTLGFYPANSQLLRCTINDGVLFGDAGALRFERAPIAPRVLYGRTLFQARLVHFV